MIAKQAWVRKKFLQVQKMTLTAIQIRQIMIAIANQPIGKTSMFRFFSLLLLLFGLFCCPETGRADELDQLLSSLIIGTWEEGNVPYGTVTFAGDGTYEAKMYSTRDKQTLLLSLEGRWKIINGELQSLLTGSNSPRAPIGESFTDKIVQINRTELVMVGMDGKQYSKYRIQKETTQ